MKSTTIDKLRERAHKEGLDKGLKEGLDKGLKEGLDKGLKEGLDKGLREGLDKGRQQGRAEVLAALIATRLGERAPGELAKRIAGVGEDVLDRVVALLAAAPSDEALATELETLLPQA